MHGLLSGANLRSALLHYLSGLALYGLAMLFYFRNSYYSGFLDPVTRKLMLYIFLAYAVISPFAFLLQRNKGIEAHKPAIFFSVLRRMGAGLVSYLNRFTKEPGLRLPELSGSERTALLFLLVKLFFVPLMLNFFIGHLRAVVSFYPQLESFRLTAETAASAGYMFALTAIFLVDTAYFSFGYVFEAGFLRNRVRSVEPTFLGWLVAIVCYPPFNGMFERYAGWYPQEYAQFPGPALALAARAAIVALLLAYVWATVSLGTKCSNLTNRGIVTTGAYRLIRHPAYASKVASWWIMIIPVMSVAALISMAAWTFVYFLRAVTEERHLIADPDYQAYCRKTKYRFVPFVY